MDSQTLRARAPHALRPTMTPAAFYDAIADQYDEFDGNLWPAENAVVSILLHRHGCAQGRVLDLGCGTGLYLNLIKKAPDDYLGVDISAGMIRQARAKHPDHAFIQADMADLGEHGEFDAAVCLFGGFSYVLEPMRGLYDIYDALRPGGKVFLMLFGRHYHRRPSYLANRVGVHLPSMLYGPRAARDHLLAAGFERVRIFGMTSRLVEPYLLWMDHGRLATYLWWEVRTVGRRWPGACYHCIAVARRPTNPLRMYPDEPPPWPGEEPPDKPVHWPPERHP